MDWSKYSAGKVRSGKNENGQRLVELFAADFKKQMGRDLNISCPKCFENDFKKFLNKDTVAKGNANWEVKPMYNGISLGFGSKVFLSNDNLTDELAERFAKEHPKGLDLFVRFPKTDAKEDAERKELKSMTRAQLDDLYGDGAEDFSNKADLIEAILKK